MMALNSEQISWGFFVKNTFKVTKYTYLVLYNVVIEFAIYVLS